MVKSYIFSTVDEDGKVEAKAGGDGSGASAMLTALNFLVAQAMLRSGVPANDAMQDLRQIAVSGVRLAADELDGGAAT